MQKNLIKLPHGGWVNPRHVVSLECEGDTAVLTLSVNDGQFEYPIECPKSEMEKIAAVINGEIVVP